MKYITNLAFAFCVISGTILGHGVQDLNDLPERTIRNRLLATQDSQVLGMLINEYFARDPILENVKQFQFDSSQRISVVANWKCVNLGKSELGKFGLLNRFVSHLQSIIGQPVPQWWYEELSYRHLQGAKIVAADLCIDVVQNKTIGETVSSTNRAPELQSLGIRHSAAVQIETFDGLNINGNLDGESFQLPFDFDGVVENYCHIAVARSDGDIFINCTQAVGVPSQIVRYDQNNKMIWKSDVQDRIIGGYGSTGVGLLPVNEIVVGKECVVVFGCNSFGFFCESFEKSTGKVLFLFRDEF